MASGKEYLEFLGLEIARRKFYIAEKVEKVVEDLCRRTEALEAENSELRARAEALACGREEIGEAILSAKTISQQLIAEAREQAETMLEEARKKAECLVAEAEERTSELSAACESREQKTIRAVEDCYLRMREECLGTAKILDSEWQRFLCSFGEEAPKGEQELPGDLSERLGAIAQSLSEIDADNENQET